MDKNGLGKHNLMKKRYSVYMPLMKKNTFTVKKSVVNIKEKNLKKKATHDEKNINDKLENNSFDRKDNKSETGIFESSYEFNSKMNKIEDTLFTLIHKNNKIRRELVELKFKKNNEINSIKINVKDQSKIKIYEELLNNYKDYNNDLNKKLNSLKKEKDTYSFINIVHKKIKLIVNTINNINNNNKELKKYGYIFDKIKELLTKNNFKIKQAFIIEGIKIIEWIITCLMTEIKEHSKNYEEGNLIERLRYRIEKDKKSNHDKPQKDEIERIIKMNKLSKKMNKIIFISRKEPDKINFTKIKKMEKK